MAELVILTRPHKGWRGTKVPMGRDLRDCYVDIRATGEDTVYLNQIAARPGYLGEGRGTEALEILCELADKHCVTIHGYATYNYELQGEDDERLWRWYERHSFEFPANEWKHARLKANMCREPKIRWGRETQCEFENSPRLSIRFRGRTKPPIRGNDEQPLRIS